MKEINPSANFAKVRETERREKSGIMKLSRSFFLSVFRVLGGPFLYEFIEINDW